MSALGKRLGKELAEWAREPEADMAIFATEGDWTRWTAFVVGPEDTPYATGKFHLRIQVE